MSEGGLKLQGGSAGAAAIPEAAGPATTNQPPPIPLSRATPPPPVAQAGVGPTAISYGQKANKKRINAEDAPDPIELGGFGKFCIWTVALLLFAGSYAAWHVAVNFGHFILANPMDMGGEEMQLDEDMEFAMGFMNEVYGGIPMDGGGGMPRGSALPGDWPQIQFAGVFKGNGKVPDGIIIDGNLVSVGGNAFGVKLHEIQGHLALLEYKGDKRWIETGGAGIGGISTRKGSK